MKKQIELKHKKPRLAYVGMDKKTLVEAVPTQVVEIVHPGKAFEQTKEIGGRRQEALFGDRQIGLQYSETAQEPPRNRLIWTNDNLVALKTLLDEKDPISGEYRYRGKVDLIYIDPPFMVQDDFIASNSIDIEVDEEEGVMSVKEPTIIETIAYKDTWQNGLDSFLQMMRERLILLKDLLSDKGSIYIHLDWHAIHYVKVLMDEIFDYGLFRNEIIWKRTTARSGSKYYNNINDCILFYTKTENASWNQLYSDYDENYIATMFRGVESDGRRYRESPLTAPGISRGKSGQAWRNVSPSNVGKGRHWAIPGYVLKELSEKARTDTILALEELDSSGRIVWSKNGMPNIKQYQDELGGVELQNIWLDIGIAKGDYPTQKPVDLLKRIIASSCPQNGIVLDAFVGSGTTCEAAEQLSDILNCSWIGIDNSKFGVHVARKRLIELNGKSKGKKGEGVYKVRPFTVENMGYYQRGVKWDPIQVGNQADAYRQAIIELFGGEYTLYSKLLHGKKKGAWVHIGPLSNPLVTEQVMAIADEVKDTEFKKCYVLSADFDAHLTQAVNQAKEKLGVQIMVRIIPASAIEEVRRRLDLIKQGVREPENTEEMPNIAFFAPLAVKINKAVDDKEIMIELSGLEVDVESFLESQKPERREELKKWLEKETSWQSFVDFWAVDWNYENLKNGLGEPIFENEWQSFRKRSGKKVVEDLVLKAFHTYEKEETYTVAVKVTDVFGNDGIITTKVVIK